MKQRIKVKLREQLLLATGLLVLLPLILIGYFVNQSVNRVMTEQALRHNSYLGQLVRSEVLKFIDKEKETLAIAASYNDLWETNTQAIHLDHLFKVNGIWQRIYFADTKTRKIITCIPDQMNLTSDYDAQTQDWYLQALSNPGSVAVVTNQGAFGDQGIITFSTIIRDNAGQIIGIIGADLSQASLSKLLRNNISISSGIDFWLVDSQGKFLLRPYEDPDLLTGSDFGAKSLDGLVYSPAFLDKVKATHITSETSLPQVGWTAILAQDPSMALADARKLSLNIKGLTLVFFILAVIGVLYYVYRLTRPIEDLLDRIHAIEQGESWSDFAPISTSSDEIGEVAKAFDKVTEELQKLLRDVITTLTTTLDARDPYTRYHSGRVSIYAHLLARYLNWTPLECENVLRAGLLHDVGKIGVPEHILNKPAALTKEEYETMKTHCQASYDIIQGIPFYVRLGIAEMVLEHHERWDGNGYPLGIYDDIILPGARVLAIADSFDAMTSDRAYRKALSLDEALAELSFGSGKQFDPDFIQVFLTIPREILLDTMGASLETNSLKTKMNRVPLISD